MMKIGERIMDAKTKTIYRVARIEEDHIILAAEDESTELVIENNKSPDPKQLGYQNKRGGHSKLLLSNVLQISLARQ